MNQETIEFNDRADRPERGPLGSGVEGAIGELRDGLFLRRA